MIRDSGTGLILVSDILKELRNLAATGKTFGAISADPPWSFNVYSGKGKSRSADRFYDTWTLERISALPVKEVAAKDCALFMWAIMPELPGAIDVIRSWGFTYKTVAFTWVKQVRTDVGKINAAPRLFTGMGYWTRANAELCLLATRGSPKRIHKDVRQILMAAVGRHSRKPPEVHARIERLVSGPYLEMFGREKMSGWTVLGNQITENLFTREDAA